MYVQARVAENKKGLDVLLGVRKEPRPRPNCTWVVVWLILEDQFPVGREILLQVK